MLVFATVNRQAGFVRGAIVEAKTILDAHFDTVNTIAECLDAYHEASYGNKAAWNIAEADARRLLASMREA